jgi:hypothetical protein
MSSLPIMKIKKKKLTTNEKFKAKYNFFYDNAMEIIESKDSHNKFCFLDVLGKKEYFEQKKKNQKIYEKKNRNLEREIKSYEYKKNNTELKIIKDKKEENITNYENSPFMNSNTGISINTTNLKLMKKLQNNSCCKTSQFSEFNTQVNNQSTNNSKQIQFYNKKKFRSISNSNLNKFLADKNFNKDLSLKQNNLPNFNKTFCNLVNKTDQISNIPPPINNYTSRVNRRLKKIIFQESQVYENQDYLDRKDSKESKKKIKEYNKLQLTKSFSDKKLKIPFKGSRTFIKDENSSYRYNKTFHFSENETAKTEDQKNKTFYFASPSKLNNKRSLKFPTEDSIRKLETVCKTLRNFGSNLEKEIKKEKSKIENFDVNSLIYNQDLLDLRSYDNINIIEDEKARKEIKKIRENIYGKESIRSKLRQLKNQINKKIKENKSITLNQFPKFKNIGDIKILKIPESFKEDRNIINLDNHLLDNVSSKEKRNIKEIYKTVKIKELKKNSYFEKLSSPRIQISNKDFLTTVLQDFSDVEKQNILIKNKILNTREKFSKSSMHINSKFFVALSNKKKSS